MSIVGGRRRVPRGPRGIVGGRHRRPRGVVRGRGQRPRGRRGRGGRGGIREFGAIEGTATAAGSINGGVGGGVGGATKAVTNGTTVSAANSTATDGTGGGKRMTVQGLRPKLFRSLRATYER